MLAIILRTICAMKEKVNDAMYGPVCMIAFNLRLNMAACSINRTIWCQ